MGVSKAETNLGEIHLLYFQKWRRIVGCILALFRNIGTLFLQCDRRRDHGMLRWPEMMDILLVYVLACCFSVSAFGQS